MTLDNSYSKWADVSWDIPACRPESEKSHDDTSRRSSSHDNRVDQAPDMEEHKCDNDADEDDDDGILEGISATFSIFWT